MKFLKGFHWSKQNNFFGRWESEAKKTILGSWNPEFSTANYIANFCQGCHKTEKAAKDEKAGKWV